MFWWDSSCKGGAGREVHEGVTRMRSRNLFAELSTCRRICEIKKQRECLEDSEKQKSQSSKTIPSSLPPWNVTRSPSP